MTIRQAVFLSVATASLSALATIALVSSRASAQAPAPKVAKAGEDKTTLDEIKATLDKHDKKHAEFAEKLNAMEKSADKRLKKLERGLEDLETNLENLRTRFDTMTRDIHENRLYRNQLHITVSRDHPRLFRRVFRVKNGSDDEPPIATVIGYNGIDMPTVCAHWADFEGKRALWLTISYPQGSLTKNNPSMDVLILSRCRDFDVEILNDFVN